MPSLPDFEEPVIGLECIVGPGDGAVGDLRPGVHGTRRQHRENAERHGEAANGGSPAKVIIARTPSGLMDMRFAKTPEETANID